MAKMNFDIFFDKLITKLTAKSASEPAGYKFEVLQDFLKVKQSVAGVYIYANFSGITPTEEANNVYQHKATYNLDCIAIYRGSRTATADELANARLRYLTGQVIGAVFDPNDKNLGMEEGDFTNLRVESITTFPLDIVTELGHQGQRITVSAEFDWSDTATGTPLEEINLTAPDWAAIFENE